MLSNAELLAIVKNYVLVMDGEYPLTSEADAIRVAERAGILYRYAKNGDQYEIRWSPAYPVMRVPAPHLCRVLMEQIVAVNNPESRGWLPEDMTQEKLMDEVKDIEIGPLPDATHAAYELAEENEVALEEVVGTGKDGKITVEDVRMYLSE